LRIVDILRGHSRLARAAIAATVTIGMLAAGLTASAPAFAKPTAAISFSHAPIVASVASHLTVTVAAGPSPLDPTGKLTLHFGSKSRKAALVPGVGSSSAVFALPALKVGTERFSVGYAGDARYASQQSAAVNVKVVPGALARLTFVKPPKSVTAGTSVKYSIDGFDAHKNRIGSETSHVTLTVSGAPHSVTIAGARVTETEARTHTVTARLDGIAATTTLKVRPGAFSGIVRVGDDTDVTVATRVVFRANSVDRFGNVLAEVSSKLKGHSTEPSDRFVKNVASFTMPGIRTITMTFKKKSFTVIYKVDAERSDAGRFQAE
jgi:Bacterial Ig-like domain (group 3)